jgi:hypothetical protein
MKRSDSVIDELASLRVERNWDRFSVSDDRTLPHVCLSQHDCFVVAEPDLPEVQILLNEVRLSWEYSGTVKHGFGGHELVERARVRSSVVKFPNNRRTKFIAATYNTVAELAGKGRQFWANGAAKAAGICLKNAAAFQARKLASRFQLQMSLT